MSDLIIIWDTETSGLIRKEIGKGHRTQPKLVSIAAALYQPDGRRVSDFNVIVKPDLDKDGQPLWRSDPGAEGAHGITTELALKYGVARRVAVAMFTNMRSRAAVSVAHNQEFDVFVIECQLAEMEVKASGGWPAKMVCTCQSDEVGALVGIPPTAKQKRYFPEKKFKAPNLTELHKFLFGEGFEGAHGAGADRDALARCYFELLKREVLKP